jgi:DNA-binding MarR family transcriptional regulator
MGKSMMDAFQEQELNLSFDQFMLLGFLNHHHQITQQELSVELRKDKSVVLRQVAVLTQLNLIERLEDKQDKRKKLLVLTSKGKTLMTKMKAYEGQIWEEMLKDIPEDNLKVLSETLITIQNNNEFKINT